MRAMDPREINWLNPHEQVTEHFTVFDCLWLGKWARLARESDGLDFDIKNSLIKTCMLGEEVRKILGVPMIVTSMYRPPAYAKLVGSTEKSPHCFGVAMDFALSPVTRIEAAKAILQPLLETLECRMEHGTTTWIHIDRRPPGPSGRYFLP
jgi:zinc D-Ala-D-Ala carboxypeptidase